MIEAWRISQLIATEDDGSKSVVGGWIRNLPVVSALGDLSMLEVIPITLEDVLSERCEGAWVRFKLADRVVWLTADECVEFNRLFTAAHQAAQRTYSQAQEIWREEDRHDE